jgi:hypothetical protein
MLGREVDVLRVGEEGREEAGVVVGEGYSEDGR